MKQVNYSLHFVHCATNVRARKPTLETDCNYILSNVNEVLLTDVFAQFLEWAQPRIDGRDFNRIRQTLSVITAFDSTITTSAFTARYFRRVIDYFQELGMHPEARGGKGVWSRQYINKMVNDVKRVFRWGVSWDLITIEEREKVCSVPVLSERDTDAPETEERTAADDRDILATLPYMSDVVQDMVCIQRGAAMRSSEVCSLRVCNLDRSRPRWVAVSGKGGMKNKIARYGVKRFIAFSLEETAILRRNCVGKSEDAFVFASDYERMGTRGYTTSSYGHAIRDAILRAREDGKNIAFWTSYQLRHAGITAMSLNLGHETAQYAAGHTNQRTTDIYDHKAETVSMEAAAQRRGWWYSGD